MTSAVTMQLEKGSAGFQPAASGILPDADGAWTSHRSVLRITRPSRRLEAGGGGQDGRAPLFDLHRSGSGKMPLKTASSPEPEAPRKLAGGAASPRAGTTGAHGKATCAPAGAREFHRPCRGGRVLLGDPVVLARGLASPPANFPRPCRAAAEGRRPGNMPAQGNALGSGSAWIQALKGRPKWRRFSARHGSPLQGFVLFHGMTQGVALGWHGLGLWPTAAERNARWVA